MAEPSIKQFVFHAGARKHIPVSGTFELTPRCNLNCRMCYIHMSAEEQREAGAELTTEQWLDIGRQAVKAGMIYLLLTGGEPLLRPDFPVLYTEMVKMGVLVSVNTNAVLMTPEIVACFAKHPPEAVNVTLYGASPDTYATLCGVRDGYERALLGIELLREAGVRVNINTTFTTCNEGDMEALVRWAQERKLPIRTAGFTFPPARNGHAPCDVCLTPEEQGRLNARFEFLTATDEHRAERRAYFVRCRELESQAASDASPLPAEGRAPGCMAGRGAFWMAWNGDMYPCGMLSAYVAQGQDFAAMWAEVVNMTSTIRLPAACRDCVYRKLCPSCAAVTYTVNGDTTACVDAMCRYIKTFADTFVRLVDEAGETHLSTLPTADGGEQEPYDPFTCL